jgi:hypothetical protein
MFSGEITQDVTVCDHFTVMGNSIHREAGNSATHTIRHQSGDYSLFKNNSLTGVEGHSGLTVRGRTRWTLVQDNYFNQASGRAPENEGATTQLGEWVVWERNVSDATNAGIPWPMRFAATHHVVARNNVTINGSDCASTESSAGMNSDDVWFINNTCLGTVDDKGFYNCSGTGCVARNNLMYSTGYITGASCASGGTDSNNWCYSTNVCRDPVDEGSDCHNPSLGSTSCGTVVNGKCTTPGYVEPAPASRGVNAGYDTVPVYDDYNETRRNDIDVGAVER